MKRHALTALGLAAVAVPQAFGAQTIDCEIEKSDYFVTVGKSLRMLPDAGLTMVVQGKLRNGEQISYAKDEPIIVADVKIVRSTPAFVPSADMMLKQDGFLGLKVRMPPKRPLAALQEIALTDGRVFSIVPVTQDHAVVANKTGELCNVAISFRVPDPYWVHGMRVEPVEARRRDGERLSPNRVRSMRQGDREQRVGVP